MLWRRHPQAVLAILFLLGVIVVCVLGAAFGTDSRHADTGRGRRNL
jgi:hypothetical protein